MSKLGRGSSSATREVKRGARAAAQAAGARGQAGRTNGACNRAVAGKRDGGRNATEGLLRTKVLREEDELLARDLAPLELGHLGLARVHHRDRRGLQTESGLPQSVDTYEAERPPGKLTAVIASTGVVDAMDWPKKGNNLMGFGGKGGNRVTTAVIVEAMARRRRSTLFVLISSS